MTFPRLPGLSEKVCALRVVHPSARQRTSTIILLHALFHILNRLLYAITPRESYTTHCLLCESAHALDRNHEHPPAPAPCQRATVPEAGGSIHQDRHNLQALTLRYSEPLRQRRSQETDQLQSWPKPLRPLLKCLEASVTAYGGVSRLLVTLIWPLPLLTLMV